MSNLRSIKNDEERLFIFSIFNILFYTMVNLNLASVIKS